MANWEIYLLIGGPWVIVLVTLFLLTAWMSNVQALLRILGDRLTLINQRLDVMDGGEVEEEES